ncbi:hypothetical protein ACFQ9H_31125 [Streptomyces sp. NPDC056517]|uniref:hypothetical protein n=1 Tax=unclassified Streptomyces TaxID=2593676 RepID=UPI0036BDBC23
MPERGEKGGHLVRDVGGHLRGEGVDGVAGGEALSGAGGFGSADEGVQEFFGRRSVEGTAAAFEDGPGDQVRDAG